MTTEVKLSRIRQLMAFYDSPEFTPAGHRVDADLVFKPMDALLMAVKSVLKELLETPGFLETILKEQPSDKTRRFARLSKHPRVSALLHLADLADRVKAARLWYWGLVGDIDEEWAPPQKEKMLEESTLEWLLAELEKRGVKR